ncbi:MAG TPA: amino acid adenylation domain-containing protein, partial [Thermoanaerobaculia bacterium]|nr:amino acid adenylation domain-containing protein [Thermoanaerobaculia bacterium]
LCAERSAEMVIGVLGILEAGGAYVPMDPSYPADRLAWLWEDSGAPLLVTQERLAGRVPGSAGHEVFLDHIPTNGLDEAPVLLSDHPAYAIYTSGSTGKPKGTLVGHSSLMGYLGWLHEGLGLAGRALPLITSLSFDASLKQLLAPLLRGDTVWIPEHDAASQPAALLGELASRPGAALNCVPSLWRAMLDLIEADAAPVPDLGTLLLGGEPLDAALVERTRAALPRVEVWNLYGPTEATANASFARVTAGGSPVIGRPAAASRLYVVDPRLEALPAGVPGELVIGGAGVARGYLGRPALTAERFVPDPFGEPGSRLYRTGDLARFRPDGQLKFLGRIDEQVKVRGFRIEPGEVEATLAAHPGVQRAVVVAREDGGDRRLVAYVVTDGEVTPEGLRAFAGEVLPAYMVPSAVELLEALPLLPGGKVDRRALLRRPAPERAAAEPAGGRVLPRNEAEEVLAAVWREVLRLGEVGVEENFFELGGDSILSIQVVSRAARAGLRLTPRQVFEHPTVAGLAAVAQTVRALPSDSGPVTGPAVLTPIQRRFFEQELPYPEHFNQALMLEGEGLRAEVLERAVARLLAHHDALRMRYELGDEEWSQTGVAPSGETPFMQIDLAALPEAARRGARETAAAALQASLDLTRGPLLRAALWTGDGADRLLLAVHHLVVDGVSWRVLVEDLETLYRGEEPAAKTTSFQRWAGLLAERAGSPELAEQAAWWLERLRGPVVPLPLDLEEGADTVGSADTVVVSLEEEETRALLQEVPRAYRTQINDVLLAALTEALGAWTGSRHLLVDLEGHGREDLFEGVDVSRTVGWFTALYPVVLDLDGVYGPGATLKAVKERLRAVPDRGLGYGLLRYLATGEAAETLRRQRQAEVVLNYLGQLDQSAEGRLLRGAAEPAGPA